MIEFDKVLMQDNKPRAAGSTEDMVTILRDQKDVRGFRLLDWKEALDFLKPATEQLFFVEFYVEDGPHGDREVNELPMWECLIPAVSKEAAEAWAEANRRGIHANIPNPINTNGYGDDDPLEYPELVLYRVTDWTEYTERLKSLKADVDDWTAQLPPTEEE